MIIFKIHDLNVIICIVLKNQLQQMQQKRSVIYIY